MKMHTGSEPELPAMIAVFRGPANGEGRHRCSIGAKARKAVEDKTTRNAAMLRHRVPIDLDMKRSAIVRAGTRCGRQRQHGNQTANCNLP